MSMSKRRKGKMETELNKGGNAHPMMTKLYTVQARAREKAKIFNVNGALLNRI